jgi:hypothetical protein
VLEDSGNENEIYGLNFENGTIEKTLTIANTTNIDWEDITKDKTVISMLEILVTMIMNERIYVFTKLIKV